jgi:hypothetical protein
MFGQSARELEYANYFGALAYDIHTGLAVGNDWGSSMHFSSQHTILMFHEMRYVPVSTARCIDSAHSTISSHGMGLVVSCKQMHNTCVLLYFSVKEGTAWLAQGVQNIMAFGRLCILIKELQIFRWPAELSRRTKPVCIIPSRFRQLCLCLCSSSIGR